MSVENKIREELLKIVARADSGELISDEELRANIYRFQQMIALNKEELPLTEKKILAVEKDDGGVEIMFFQYQSAYDKKVASCAAEGRKCIPITEADIPSDRTFRNSWTLSE